MTTDYRDLITRMAKELDNYRQLLLDDRTATHRLSDEARAALADEPAVPQGREPAAVTGQPSDEELLDLLPQGNESGFWLPKGLPSDWVDGEFIAPPKAIIAFARDVLELWGNPTPQPPADGEVAELTGQLIEAANGAAAMGWDQHARSILRAAELLQRQAPQPPADGEVVEVVEWLHTVVAAYKSCHNTDHIWSLFGNGANARLTVTLLTRAAELLQRQALVPVPDAERPWEREGWCDELGRCWWGRPDTGDWSADWTLATPEAIAEFCEFSPQTVCLPAHALPLPEVGE